ncbi:TIGR03826 family flagellar region protein [Paenibacillus soyae]|uniref:Flagellar protein n=1 Tax=Paenibacillus soyae TaxID=2969249 RepID=A0A9X2MUH3_9BACL|nr:TIGR03826 family flagellar region protein [Paenibacillus soyae]MCR2806740.1 flagellar protein [Paenibacillus soyae]
MNVDNCPRCGKIFAKNFRDVCPACMKDIDREYQLCADYLRENKGAIIHELSDATGVAIRQITKFIREGRISIVNAPNMSFPCESCGTLIRENHLCEDCRSRLTKDTRRMMEDESAKAAQLEKQKQAEKTAYRGISEYKGR